MDAMEHKSHHGGGGMMPMQMYFEAGTHVTLWLHSWRTSSVTRYIVSLVGLAILAVGAELLGALRARLAKTSGDGMAVRPDVEGGSAASEPLLGFLSARASSSRRLNVLLAFLYSAHMAICYLLMLAVMTFNVGFFIAVVIGFGIGHYVTSNQRAKASVGDLCCPAP